jgi:hypothetical protein
LNHNRHLLGPTAEKLSFCRKHFIPKKFLQKRCAAKLKAFFTMDLLYYNRKCSLSDLRRAPVYGRFLGILFILSFAALKLNSWIFSLLFVVFVLLLFLFKREAPKVLDNK